MVDQRRATRLVAGREFAGVAEFPFDHRLEVAAELTADDADADDDAHRAARARCRSRSATTRSCSCRACRAPSGRSRCRSADRLLLDERLVPTGERVPAGDLDGPLGDRTFDDGFTLDALRGPFVLSGGGRRIEVAFEAGYPYAQIFAPAIADVICFEPMTAPADALRHSPDAVAPGESFSARFSVSVSSTPKRCVRTLTDQVLRTAHRSRPYLPPRTPTATQLRVESLPSDASSSRSSRGRQGPIPEVAALVEVSKKGRTTCVGPHGPLGPLFSRPCRSALPPAAAATTVVNDGKGETDTGTKVPEKAKTGGKLTVLWTGDVDHIDCGQTYYQMGNFICNATQKQLYNYKPDDGATMVPDLADGDPQVSEDGKTVTVKIKSGVKYSPPYNKEVTSADVKYAIERGFFNSVASGFTPTYYADLEGAKVGVDAGTKI